MMKKIITYIILSFCCLNISAQDQKVEGYELKLDSITEISQDYLTKEFVKSGYAKFEYNFQDNSQKITSESTASVRRRNVSEYDGFGRLVSDSLFYPYIGGEFLLYVNKLDYSTSGVVIDTLFIIQESASFDPDMGAVRNCAI